MPFSITEYEANAEVANAEVIVHTGGCSTERSLVEIITNVLQPIPGEEFGKALDTMVKAKRPEFDGTGKPISGTGDQLDRYQAGDVVYVLLPYKGKALLVQQGQGSSFAIQGGADAGKVVTPWEAEAYAVVDEMDAARVRAAATRLNRMRLQAEAESVLDDVLGHLLDDEDALDVLGSPDVEDEPIDLGD
jgi:hypothetical protein